MKIPNHYLKVHIFTYLGENLAIIFILQTTFQNQDVMVISLRDVFLGCCQVGVFLPSKFLTVYIFTEIFKNTYFWKVLNISC